MTKGDSVDPEGEVSHRSDRRKAAAEEKETFRKLKEDEMEVDADGSRVLKSKAQKGRWFG